MKRVAVTGGGWFNGVVLLSPRRSSVWPLLLRLEVSRVITFSIVPAVCSPPRSTENTKQSAFVLEYL